MIVKLSKLSDFKVKKIIWSFCVDVDATKTSLIVGVNCNTVNRFFNCLGYSYVTISLKSLKEPLRVKPTAMKLTLVSKEDEVYPANVVGVPINN